jgi:hypothetical protein
MKNLSLIIRRRAGNTKGELNRAGGAVQAGPGPLFRKVAFGNLIYLAYFAHLRIE